MTIDEVIKCLEKDRLSPTIIYIERNEPRQKNISVPLHPRPGDSFNSRSASLIDSGIMDLDTLLELPEKYQQDYFLPDLLPFGILALTPNMKEGVWRYTIDDVLLDTSLPGDITTALITRPVRKQDSTEINYFQPEKKAQVSEGPVSSVSHSESKYGLKGWKTRELYGVAMTDWIVVESDIGKYPILRDDNKSFNPKRGIKPGDLFNAIMMRPSERETDGDNRIFQFIHHNHIGYVKPFNMGIYDIKSTEDINIGFVYRFEVMSTHGKKGHEFHCRPIELLTAEYAADVNFTKEKHAALPRRGGFEYMPSQEYIVGIDHLEHQRGKTVGFFYDALKPKTTGMAFFQPEQMSLAEKLENGGYAEVLVTRVKESRNGRYLVLSDIRGIAS